MVMSFNTRSIRNKIQETTEYLKDNNIQIAFVQETWLNAGDNSILAEINDYGYNIITQNRTQRDTGGGVAVLTHPDISLTRHSLKDAYKTFEYIGITLKTAARNTFVFNIYRPPYSKNHRFTVKSFLRDFTTFVKKVVNLNGRVIILGDFNLHLEDEADSYVSQFNQLLTEYGLHQHVKTSTHKDGGTIDLVITQDESSISKLKIDVNNTLTSDHFPILFELKTKLNPEDGKRTSANVRDFKKMDIKAFKDKLKSRLPEDQLEAWKLKTADELVEIYNSTIKKTVDNHCPAVLRSFKRRPFARWYNDNLKDLKRKTRRAERKFLKTLSPSDRDKVREIKNKYNWEQKVQRSKFYKDTINNNKKDIKNMYKVINQLAGNTEDKMLPKGESDRETANKFAAAFTDKITGIRRGIDEERLKKKEDQKCTTSSTTDETTNATVNLSEFRMITYEEFQKVIASMNSKHCSLDPLPTSILKSCLDELGPLMLCIIKKSLEEGKFPKALKHSIVTPIIKDRKADQNDFKVYRPVSNTPFLGKLIEKVVLQQTTTHLETNGLFAKYQSGYRKHHSCESAMFRVMNDIMKAKKHGKSTVLVLLDLSAAFDTIDHTILLNRLRDLYGISGTAHAWIESYLKGRTFQVTVGEASSDLIYLLFGVPQGSLLGPILFTLYIKKLEYIAAEFGLSIQVYADDTQLYISFSHEDTSDVISVVEACLQKIEEWMKENYLQLNAAKTQIMLFDHKCDIKDLTLNVGGNDITPSPLAKTLGVRLDDQLNMKTMILEKCRSSYFHLRNIGRIKYSLDKDTRILLVHNLIHSKLDYCNSLLANCPNYLIEKLQKVQNAAVRMIFSYKKGVSTRQLLKEVHFLPVSHRVKFKLCLIAHKSLLSESPEYISEELLPYQPNRLIRVGRDRFSLIEDKKMDNTIVSTLIRTWNKLPLSIRNVTDTSRFKRVLKSHYFQECYG